MLNSTPLREALNGSQRHRHRTRAGPRIGDEQHVDRLAYVAWLARELDIMAQMFA